MVAPLTSDPAPKKKINVQEPVLKQLSARSRAHPSGVGLLFSIAIRTDYTPISFKFISIDIGANTGILM